MGFTFKKIMIYTAMTIACPIAEIASAADSGKNPNIATQSDSQAWKNFVELRRKFRVGELNDKEMWNELTTIGDQITTLKPEQQASVLQTQASILQKTGYPILSAVYASQSLKKTATPLDDEFKRSWQILRDVSREFPIQNLLESVAAAVRLGDKVPAAFGTDWNFIIGNVYAATGQADKAQAAYANLKITDRFFYSGKYQQAMLHLTAKKPNEAIAALKSIVMPATRERTLLSGSELDLITNDANLALGRIYYELRQFPMSIKHYRLVSRTGEYFYESLFEQSWSLFMAGFPNHALGMIYSVRSPFYKEHFNPEATMLASIIYYWMCRYDDSRNELADFIQNHEAPIKALSDLLDRKTLTDDAAYTLFENTVTGVSSEGLGLPRTLLANATERDSMMHVRDQYASVLSELQRLDAKGVFGNRNNVSTVRSYLEQWAATLRKDIGKRLIVELTAMREDFDRLHEQAEFLYVELLMSQKDQLLGKELHGNSKIDKLSKRENIASWGDKTQSWAGDDKMEYWQDEVGYHIYRLEPLCKN